MPATCLRGRESGIHPTVRAVGFQTYRLFNNALIQDFPFNPLRPLRKSFAFFAVKFFLLFQNKTRELNRKGRKERKGSNQDPTDFSATDWPPNPSNWLRS
jgi:hypothetical protein